MTPLEYRAALDALGLTQEGCAELMGYSARRGQGWASLAGGGPPPGVAILLRLLLAGTISPADIAAAQEARTEAAAAEGISGAPQASARS